MTDPRYWSDPPRPPNETPGSWYRKNREREKNAADPDVAKARAEGKEEVKASLRRIAGFGKAALDFALSVLDTEMSMEEIEKVSAKIPPQGSTMVHKPRTVPQPRLAEPEEEEWFQKAKADAEAQWNRAMGHPMPQRQLTPEDIALAESFNAIAAKAAGLTHEEDGRKRWRADTQDADLYRRGEESARKIWPGR